MATITESLKGINAYPIPLRAILDAAVGRGLDPNAESDQTTLMSKEYRLAEADLFLWLSVSPNVVQGGQNYSWNTEQRKYLRDRANGIYSEFEDDSRRPKSMYGYKGSVL